MPNVEQVASLDVSDVETVEVIINSQETVLWVNIDGICRFRVSRIKKGITLERLGDRD